LPSIDRYMVPLFVISAILGIIGLAIGGVIYTHHPYAAWLYFMICAPMVAFSIAGAVRTKLAKTDKDKATYAIQNAWWVLSLGFTGLLLFPAPFFMERSGAFAYVLIGFCVYWLLAGIYGVYKPHKDANVSITV